ncbi:transcriptional regulator [Halobacteriales archaeon QS_1_68_20]|nr:MAG: transcriptional regulator [Halobacteriales archaeon QS_1_68_20]
MDPDDDGPPTDLTDLASEWEDVLAGQSTRDRVYGVAVQLYEPTRVRAVAERADVSKETARDYLRWFADVGMVDQVAESPDTFVRNESYFRWRRVQKLRELSPEERRERVEHLTEREREFRETYDADGPDAVDAVEHADYADVEAVWDDLDEWRTVRRRLRELDRARRDRDSGEAPA